VGFAGAGPIRGGLPHSPRVEEPGRSGGRLVCASTHAWTNVYFLAPVTKGNAGVMGALIRMANCRLGFTVLESSKKGLAFQGRPSLFSTLRSAHYDYRQQASICWQLSNELKLGLTHIV